MNTTPDSSLRLLRLPEVMDKVGLKHASLYKLIGRGEFPAPVKIGPKAARWPEHEIDSWIQAKLAAREVHAAE